MSLTKLHREFHDRPASRVLMLTHRAPYPPDRGDRIRSWNLLRELSRNFQVSLACISDEPINSNQYLRLSQRTHRLAIQRIDPLTTPLRSLNALATGRALTPTMLFRRSLAKKMIDWHAEEPFDAVLTFCSGMIDYARLLTNVRYIPRGVTSRPVRHILDLVDVDSVKWQRYAETSKPPMSWVYGLESRRLRKIESGRDDWFDAITVVSDAEAQTYRNVVGEHSGLEVVSNGVDLRYFFPLPDAEKPKIAFVGVLDYKPNVEGAWWFAKEVLPQILERVPNAQFMIVGRRPNERVKVLGAHPNVQVVGDVPDVRKYLSKAAAVIAPLQIAPGVQNKVLEAMASKRAVVCTPAAAAGINATPGEHLLVGNNPRHFATLTARLLTDRPYRQNIAEKARKQVEDFYSWQRALLPMMELVAGQPFERRERPESPITQPPALAA